MIIKKYFIPNFISLSSILCGFISIILSSYNNITFAAYLIILGAIFDGIDGKVARAMKATNAIGKEMDSLADLTTFGIATGFLLYQGSLYKFGNLGIIIASLIPICSALRLARFNMKPTKGFFEGMPTTWAGISIAILQGVYYQNFPRFFYLALAIITSLLMVSKFKYEKMNKVFFKSLPIKIMMVLTLLMMIINFRIAFLVPIFWYSTSGIFSRIFIRPKAQIKPYKVKY